MTTSNVWRLEWSEGLSVGIPEIDLEHRHFIGLVNSLNEAILDRLELGEIERRMRLILEDAGSHFAHEERLFAEWSYPEAAEHAGKHAEISLALQKIMRGISTRTLEPELIEIGLAIRQTLVDHLLIEDMKYSAYYRQMNR